MCQGTSSLANFLSQLLHHLLTILYIQSLEGLAVKQAALQVEVATGAVSIDGLADRLDTSSTRFGNVGLIGNVENISGTRFLTYSARSNRTIGLSEFYY